ncbi:dTMP kinase [Halioxenophilus sp. WMMB6]|uniref:dTMP kinase n=1 Tax=Halioxenophilus sp. WMMB6 TaxID=3073815 RepID=UPI00295EFFB6|nr:dTMP kinase [Halioxenophilus sp. WMMB6]
MDNNKRGRFITFEGVEGGGKSSNIPLVKNLLSDAGIDVVVTREPGGTPLAEEIRQLILAKRDEHVDDCAELLLVFAARAQHFNRLILPALEAGKWVLCDRFTDATYAYQGAGRGLAMQTIALLENLVQGELRPDLTLLFDLDVATGMARARGRGDLDRFELQELAFFERIRALYLERLKTESYYRLIDASKTPIEVGQQVSTAIQKFMGAHQ